MTKTIIWTYIISVLCIIGGVFLLVKPMESTSSIIYYLGILMIIIGVFKAISSLINKDSMFLPGSYFFSGIINLLFGIILINNTTGVTKTIALIIGLWLIINAASNLALCLNGKRSHSFEITYIVTNILKLILGLVVLTTPLVGIIFTSSILGIILIVIGAGIIYNNYRNRKIYKVKVK